MMMFGGPERGGTSNRTREVPIDGFLKLFHIDSREIPGVLSMVVNEFLGLLVVLERRFLPARQLAESVAVFPHEREEGVHTRNSSRVATLEPAGLVQALRAEEIRAEEAAVHEQHCADASLGQFSTESRHGLLPGERIRRGPRLELAIAHSFARI